MNKRSATVILGALGDLIPSWRRHLRVENKAPTTSKNYIGWVNLVKFLLAAGMPSSALNVTRDSTGSKIEWLVSAAQRRPQGYGQRVDDDGAGEHRRASKSD